MIAVFLGLSPALLAYFVAVIVGGGYAISLLATRRADGQSRVPFGSFLAAGGMVAALYVQQILDWYKALL